jgi:hypothetical protein
MVWFWIALIILENHAICNVMGLICLRRLSLQAEIFGIKKSHTRYGIWWRLNRIYPTVMRAPELWLIEGTPSHLARLMMA